MTEDEPDLDGTDFAHPAWWRGHDSCAQQIVAMLERTIKGDDNGSGVIGSAGLERIRRWILAHR